MCFFFCKNYKERETYEATQTETTSFSMCVGVYFGTNGYLHFFTFNHTSKRKCVCVPLELTTKCTNFKLKQTFEFFHKVFFFLA